MIIEAKVLNISGVYCTAMYELSFNTKGLDNLVGPLVIVSEKARNAEPAMEADHIV